MTGRGRSRGLTSQQQAAAQSRTGEGRGRVEQQAPFLPAPAPATSAWGQSAPAAQAPPAAQAVGLPSYRGTAEASRGRGRTQQPQQPQQQQQPQPQQQQQPPPQQQSCKPRGNGGGGGNGGAPADRGSMRGRTYLPITDIIKTRPENVQSKRGTSGQSLTLTTNYFRLLKQPTWQLYQYRVDFAPSIELRGLRNRMIYEQKNTLGGYLFDGTMLFLSVKLANDVTIFMSMDRDQTPIQTTVKFVNLVSMATAASVQVLNLILRRSMESLNLQLVGRNFFDAIAKVDIPQYQLQLWPGYVTSIRQHELDVLLCAEVTNKVMRMETVYDILQDCVKNRRDDFQTAFQQATLGITVLTGYNNKTYRIDDVDFSLSPMSTFDTRDGPVTYCAYYEKKYNLKIRDKNQPLLVHRASQRDIRGGQAENISLIPELCRVTGMSDQMRDDRKLMSAVAIYTRLAPKARIEKLNAFNRRLQTTAASVSNLAEWNFKLDNNLVQVNGRVLPKEKILFANKKTVVTNNEADWSRDFRNNSMFTSQHLKNWVLITPQRRGREAQVFVGILQQAARGMRYDVSNPVVIDIQDDRVNSYAAALDEAANRNPQLIMCIVPNNQADRYSMIKKKLCVERAVPSQVMVARTITPKPGKPDSSLLSVGTKVAIQINSKLGGAPWMVDIPLGGLMVVGFDVCHDTKDKSKSYGALVATMDMKVAQNYFSAVSPHNNGEELSNAFALNLTKALRAYGNQHKCLPSKIVIYRDGVGEGQTNYVFEHEVKNIRAKLEQMYQGAEYKLAFVVVSKRINTRFFKGLENPGPGTVVDDVVTLPERYDFYLCSQHVGQGTVSPTSYNILYDTSGLTPDRMQVLSYKMTHLYYNWAGTLAVPAVCQYAHKLAFLVGNFIHQSPSSDLEKQLYFL